MEARISVPELPLGNSSGKCADGQDNATDVVILVASFFFSSFFSLRHEYIYFVGCAFLKRALV